MVRKAEARIKKYSAKIASIPVYIRRKRVKFLPIKKFTADTEKDAIITELWRKYGLDLRKRTLAMEAFRELYFMYYRTLQKFKVITK